MLSLIKQFNKEFDYVRQHVASNEKINFKIQQQLSSDKSQAVRHSLSQNKNLDISILEKLINDEDSFIAHSALANPAISAEQRTNIHNKILNRLIGHPYNCHSLQSLIGNGKIFTMCLFSL